ncbi:MAG: prepilin-type N-terminal cleavage/methylation domain-containing protein [Gemmatimonadales bacterium]|nr:prepilin-type N-terminal cleavage/methylation domain-containing protein [Gemmatimonadales bacterium]
MNKDSRLLNRAGFTLPEVLVTLIILSIVMTAAVGTFRSQNQAFIKGNQRMDALQNERYAVGTVERVLRTLGTGVSGDQPMLVYGGNDVVAFNTDYTENDTTQSRWAVTFNPDADSSSTIAWDSSAQTLIPNTTYLYPTKTYRMVNGAISPSETQMFYLTPDASTVRADDYRLMQRVNAAAAELVARNILAYPGRPFFQYFMKQVPANITIATGGTLPLIRRPLLNMATAADTAAAVRPDSVGGIRINIRITNGLTGTEERTQDLSTLVEVPNNGLPQPLVCGRSPLPPTALVATAFGGAGSGSIRLIWTQSPDHAGGENDVRQYVVYQRDDTATVWRDPLMNFRADTTTFYVTTVGGLTSGAAYRFGVAAQDCTPASSTILSRLVTAP